MSQPAPLTTPDSAVFNGVVNPGSDEFGSVLKRLVSLMATIPGRPSEQGIKRLARQNGFEIFEDNIPDGKRISLGCKIVLIDVC
jgi:hypothetical protein